MGVELKKNERVDRLHRKGYNLIQNPDLFCFGVDAVFLAHFSKSNETDRVLDMGTGNGIIPILMVGRYNSKQIIGLEIQKINVDMAKRSVQLNHLEDKIHIVEGDIRQADQLLPLSSFDLITCNPPYMPSGKGLKNSVSVKAIARHEILCTLEDVIRAGSRLVKVGGRLCLIHRPQRLVDLLSLLRQYKMEPKRMRFIHPYKDEAPNLVMVEAIRQGKPMMKVEAPLFVYKAAGIYSDEINEIYGYEEE